MRPVIHSRLFPSTHSTSHPPPLLGPTPSQSLQPPSRGRLGAHVCIASPSTRQPFSLAWPSHWGLFTQQQRCRASEQACWVRVCLCWGRWGAERMWRASEGRRRACCTPATPPPPHHNPPHTHAPPPRAEGRGANGLAAWRARRGVLLDVATLPDAEPLTQKVRVCVGGGCMGVWVCLLGSSACTQQLPPSRPPTHPHPRPRTPHHPPSLFSHPHPPSR